MLPCAGCGPSFTFAVAVNGSLSVSAADTAVNALHRVLAQPQAVLQDVHHDLELTKYQDLQDRCTFATPLKRS